MSFTYKLLEIIKDLGAIAADYMVSPYEVKRRLNSAIRQGSGYRVVGSYVALNRLTKNGLLNKKKTGKYVRFSITEKGKRFLKKREHMKKRTDGFSTVIMFDIPEDKHGARDSFRRYLVRNGFIVLQKSVMIGPVYISGSARALAEELGIKNNIKLFSAKSEQL